MPSQEKFQTLPNETLDQEDLRHQDSPYSKEHGSKIKLDSLNTIPIEDSNQKQANFEEIQLSYRQRSKPDPQFDFELKSIIGSINSRT